MTKYPSLCLVLWGQKKRIKVLTLAYTDLAFYHLQNYITATTSFDPLILSPQIYELGKTSIIPFYRREKGEYEK